MPEEKALETENLRRTQITEKLKRIVEEFDQLPVLDDRTADEILGYDESARVCPVLCVNDQGLFFGFGVVVDFGVGVGSGDRVQGKGVLSPSPAPSNIVAVIVFNPRSFPGWACARATGC